MPFKSKAQRRKFYALKAEGKMDQRTIDEWEAETSGGLPEKLGSFNIDRALKRLAERRGTTVEAIMAKKNGFWDGFQKRAVETFVPAGTPPDQNPDAQAGEAPEKMLKWNELGGVDPRTPEDLQVAGAVMLITLPNEVQGANCSNCTYFRGLNPALGVGFCTNPQVKQDVTERMLCAMWEHPGSHSPADAAAEEEALAAEQQAAAGEQGEAPVEGDPMAQDIMADFQQPSGAEEAPPEESAAKPKEKAEPKEKSSGSAHTININVGKDGKEKKAGFWAGFGGKL